MMSEEKLERVSKYAHLHLTPGYLLLRHVGYQEIPRIYEITRVDGKDVYGVARPEVPVDRWWELNHATS